MFVELRAEHNQDADARVFDKQAGARLLRASSSCSSSKAFSYIEKSPNIDNHVNIR